MKQTAVEWIYKALLLDEDNLNYNEWVFNKAKAMEKEQIIEASANAYKDMFGSDGTKYGEEYYNKTFKSE